MSPPRYCDFLEELVVDDGIKTLRLHLRATRRGRCCSFSVAFILDLHVTMYTGSLILTRYLQDNILFVFSEPIEVKVGLLFENVLTGCTVTKSKCSRITQELEFYTAREDDHFKIILLVGWTR